MCGRKKKMCGRKKTSPLGTGLQVQEGPRGQEPASCPHGGRDAQTNHPGPQSISCGCQGGAKVARGPRSNTYWRTQKKSGSRGGRSPKKGGVRRGKPERNPQAIFELRRELGRSRDVDGEARTSWTRRL
ncbi:hypothetical protein SUGI_0578240 [Cryptomeria japonica]|nr:hypothetical protein SUGI_0578240 [Cryptomeria japonica]